MTPEDTNPKQHSVTKVIYRFLLGTFLSSAFVVIVSTSYGSIMDLSLVQVGALSVLVILCGLLSSIWGEKFIDAVMRMMESFGF
jgi:hypothetical protein